MTLPNSGTISASMINAEWTRGNTSRFALSADGAGLIGKPSISTIRYSDFYGKSALNPQPPVGSGGTVQDKNGYRHHIFSSSGQFCITKSAVDGKPVDIQYLCVGGGAGGGGGGEYGNDKSEMGGGGGAGGMLTGSIDDSVACYSLNVGYGGAGGVAYPSIGRGGNGGASSVTIGSYKSALGGGVVEA